MSHWTGHSLFKHNITTFEIVQTFLLTLHQTPSGSKMIQNTGSTEILFTVPYQQLSYTAINTLSCICLTMTVCNRQRLSEMQHDFGVFNTSDMEQNTQEKLQLATYCVKWLLVSQAEIFTFRNKFGLFCNLIWPATTIHLHIRR